MRDAKSHNPDRTFTFRIITSQQIPVMSESTAVAPSQTTLPVDEPFDREDIKGFSADDVEAGRAICQMLSLFFFYTVIVMGLSTYVTYRWVFGG